MTKDSPENSNLLIGATKRSGSVVRPISQVLLKIAKNKKDSEFNNVRRVVLQWIQSRAGRYLPEKAWKGEPFTYDEVGAQPVEVIAIEGYWASRLDDADKEVARRVWRTEITIAENKDRSVFLGTRLHCVTHGEDRPFDPSIPGFIRNIVSDKTAYLDERIVSVNPWIIDSEDEVDKLYVLLTNPHRRSEVFVFSSVNSANPDKMKEMAVRVAKNTVGAAHVVILTGKASRELSDRVGEEFSVYGQAVRTYRPGFDPNIDTRFSHPLVLARRIAEWDGREEKGETAYEKFLVSQALRRSVSTRDMPSFATVRRLITGKLLQRSQRNTGSSYEEQLAQQEDYIEGLQNALEKQEEDYVELIDLAERERDQALKESKGIKAQNWHLRDRIESLSKKLENAGGSVQQEIPDNLDNFENWCHENLSGSVQVLKKALQHSQYDDPSLIFKALLVLRDYYVPMRQRQEDDDELKKKFEEECRKLGITEAPSIARSRMGEQDDAYYIDYLGEKKALNRHLKKGTSRDPRRCFRLYFFWDDENGQVVVGWLTSHLPTRIT